MTPSSEIFHRLLVPVDGSESSRKAARFAIRMAGRQKCEIDVIHVVDEENASEMARYVDRPTEDILEKMRRSGERYVDEVREIAEKEGVVLVGEVRIGIPHRTVLKAAAEKKADLIVMGTVGRKGPRRVLIGSVTERVIEQSAIPVLVVK